MRQMIDGEENYCLECGHLLSARQPHCPFCGWSLHDFPSDDSGFDVWDSAAELDTLANTDTDIDRLIDTL
ncbi:MAG: hypothetical protein H8E81_04115 [Deltaproteobacteria bacterium]|nr:hypothetical protein [Deltaproteobacteria bacterium]